MVPAQYYFVYSKSGFSLLSPPKNFAGLITFFVKSQIRDHHHAIHGLGSHAMNGLEIVTFLSFDYDPALPDCS
jgi:hypothetical protein